MVPRTPNICRTLRLYFDSLNISIENALQVPENHYETFHLLVLLLRQLLSPPVSRAGLMGREARSNFHWRARMTYFMTPSFV